MDTKRIKNNELLEAMKDMNESLKNCGIWFTNSLTKATLFGLVYGIYYDVEIVEYDRYKCGCIDHDNGSWVDHVNNLPPTQLISWLEDHEIDCINQPEVDVEVFCDAANEAEDEEDADVNFNLDYIYGKITVTIYNDIDSLCEWCQEKEDAKLFVEDMPPIDNLFDNEIVSHGLAAYRGSQNEDTILAAYKNISDAMAAGTDIAICCSNKAQRIGPVGIYVRGHVYCASNIDLYSEREGDSRYVDTRSWRYQQGIIYSKDQIDLTRWIHNEYIVNPREIIGFWMKDWAIKQWPGLFERIRNLCKAHNMVLHVAKKRH